jgi:hypothetical protein
LRWFPAFAGVSGCAAFAAAPPSTVLAFVRSGNMLDGRVVGFSSLLVVLLVSFECPLERLRVFFFGLFALLLV